MRSDGRQTNLQAAIGQAIIAALPRETEQLKLTELAEVFGAVLGASVISFRNLAHSSTQANSTLAQDFTLAIAHVIAAGAQAEGVEIVSASLHSACSVLAANFSLEAPTVMDLPIARLADQW